MNTYIPGKGPFGAKIIIVSDCPTYDDETHLRLFSGSEGRELDKLCRDSGLNRNDCWITSLSKFMVPPNEKGKHIPFHTRAKIAGIDLDAQINDLRVEINEINPNLIIAFGSSALWGLTGKTNIDKWRGSIIQGFGRKLIATYHPAHLLHMGGEVSGYWQRQVMVFDLKRAVIQSAFPEIIRPSRTLNVCQNSAQLYDFIQRHKNYNHPSVDIEARGSCMPVCIGLAFTKHEGLTVPLWNDIGSESISSIPDNDLVNCWILLAKLLAESDVRGSNFNYDRDKIKRLGFIVRSLFSDTMLKSFAINPELPKNLAFNTSLYTEEPYYKDEGMYEGSITDLLMGCSRDACVTVEVDDAMNSDLEELGLRNFYNNFLMKLSPLYGQIENEGFLTDLDKREELLKKYIEWDEKLRLELWKNTGEYINVNSPKQVSELLYKTLNLRNYGEGTGEEVITGLLKIVKDSKTTRILEIILERRRVTKTIGTYLMSRLDYDGRMKTSYFLCLKTGRTGTNLLEEPIRPIVTYKDSESKALKKKSVGIAFQTMTKHGDIGEDIRSMYVADPGEVFIQLDSSQAEARVVFLLADDEQALKDIDEHDYHALTASWFFGGTENDYSKKVLGYESPIRFAGKAQPLDSKILTPTGWKLMKDIQIGDEICNSQYKISKVTGVFSQGIKEVFKITLSDKSEVESCKEHLWQIQSIWNRQRDMIEIKRLEDIMNLSLFNSRGNPKYSIQNQAACWFNYQSIPIDPYILGCLLGDGHLGKYKCTLTTDDREILQEFIERLGYEKISQKGDGEYYIHGLNKEINNLKLTECKSFEKFIPDIYKFNSLFNRLELLQGLMDTDGTINEFGSAIEYSSSSEKLANDVIDLVRSMGGIANMTNRIPKYKYKGEVKEGKRSYRVFINIRQLNPFKLTRKAERWERWNSKTKYDLARNIISIEKSRETECQCISVDSEDSLYITDNFILTHNTLRHAGHLGAGKRRASTELNTQARKYKIPISITEYKAGQALETFHKMQPKIQKVFHASVIKIVEKTRMLTAPLPYGIDSEVGGKRIFFERYNDELFREAFSYLPQRAVSDNTKAAALRIKARAPWIRILLESHDALLLSVPFERLDEAVFIGKNEMERELDFTNCSISRRKLIIPCEVETGFNYKDLKKFSLVETEVK